MITMRRTSLALAMVLVLLVAGSALAGTATGSGYQRRGAPGRNAELTSTPLIVPAGVTATITDVTCDGDGFWIEGPVSASFSTGAEAIGFRLPSGTYRFYPNLKEGQFPQQKAMVSVTATWP